MGTATAEKVQAEKTVTPVLNNRESLIQIQLPGKPGKQGLTAGPRVDLIPGMNFVDTDYWTKAKENAVCASMLTETIQPSRAPEQNPERVGKPILVEGKPISRDNPLGACEEADAVKMVGELFDVPAMKRFLLQEDRPEVVMALKGQIAKIETAKGAQTKKPVGA